MKPSLYTFVCAVLLTTACTTDISELEQLPSMTGEPLPVRLNGTFQAFDAEASDISTITTVGDVATRAAISWTENDTLFIQWQSGSSIESGVMIYKDGAWQMTDWGNITAGQTLPCSIYLFRTPVSSSVSARTLGPHVAVWGDTDGTIILEDGTFTVTTHIKPLTARIRFKGSAGQKVVVSGMKWNKSYTLTGGLTQEEGTINLTINSTGYSPYIYANFVNTTNRQLIVELNECNFCSKRFGDNVLATGKSGYVTAPTLTNYNGWTLTTYPSDPLGLCPNNHHPHMIDMGTGVKFACCNVGADSPIGYGDYFAWGEITPKSTYTWATYKWCNGASSNITKYCLHSNLGTVDKKIQLELADDAARANWGGTWRMPTIDELEKLNSECTWTWTTLSNVKGYEVTAENGNTLFLPAAGRSGGGAYIDEGGFWSSSLQLSNDQYSRFLGFRSNYHSVDLHFRYFGRSVRPVSE